MRKKAGFYVMPQMNWKPDKELVLKAAKTDGQILYYVSKELRDDYDVVLETVKNKGLIVKYASKRLRSDRQ